MPYLRFSLCHIINEVLWSIMNNNYEEKIIWLIINEVLYYEECILLIKTNIIPIFFYFYYIINCRIFVGINLIINLIITPNFQTFSCFQRVDPTPPT